MRRLFSWLVLAFLIALTPAVALGAGLVACAITCWTWPVGMVRSMREGERFVRKFYAKPIENQEFKESFSA